VTSRLRTACAALGAAAWLSACGAGDAPPPRHVLLLTVDTLRADHLSRNGYDRPTTPRLDALVAQGVYFTRAATPIPQTTQALASLLTGVYPHGHRVRDLTDRLPADVAYLPELAREAGYRTIAVVSNHVLTPARGLGRGFEVYDAADDARAAPQTTRAALHAVAALRRDERVFLWVHYIDPHVPYLPPPELARSFDPSYAGPYAAGFGQRPGGVGDGAYPADLPKRIAVFANPLPPRVNEHVRRLYAADVRATDDAIAQLLDELDSRFGADWLVVFAADHGEGLGEHGYFYDHGDFLHEPGLRVPLAFVLPPGHPLRRPAEVSAVVSLVDVAPTLADLMRLDFSAAFAEGRSLTPLLAGGSLEPRPSFAETGQSFFPDALERRVRFDVAGRQRAVIDGRWKLVWTPGLSPELGFELYDLVADPGETRDLHRTDHPEAERLRALLFAWLRDAKDRPPQPASADDLRRLRELGYVEP
jgi:arylsulfatase A-like enzyme